MVNVTLTTSVLQFLWSRVGNGERKEKNGEMIVLANIATLLVNVVAPSILDDDEDQDIIKNANKMKQTRHAIPCLCSFFKQARKSAIYTTTLQLLYLQ